MAQLPFEPFDLPESDDADAGPGDALFAEGETSMDETSGGGGGGGTSGVLTVSQLASGIREALAVGLPAKVSVVGEVSNFSNRQHWFFSLKDAGAALRCVCFASNARRVRCVIEDGMQVVARGRVDFYDAQGSVQLYVDALEPAGLGALEQQLRRRMAELADLGYFSQDHKRPLPGVPARIAIVTSKTGAAVRDFIRIAHQRFPGVELLIYDVRVQGAQAAPEIAAAIQNLSDQHAALGVDIVVVTRGGGSLEDLWAFNERIVADAIYACRVPVIAAIGHEVDTTIAELTADLRCATPSHAAQAATPERAVLLEQVTQQQRRLSTLWRRRLEHERHRVAAAARHPLFRQPERLIQQRRRDLASVEQRLLRAMAQRLPAERARLDRLAARLPAVVEARLRAAGEAVDAIERELAALSPQRVLDRGYSYTLGPDGRVLRQPSQVHAGDRLTTRLAGGEVQSRVVPPEAPEAPEVQDNPNAPQPADVWRPAPRRRSRKAKRTQDGPGLFG